jgi:hypothetical protein
MNPGSAYLDHLTDADLSILGGAVDAPAADDASAYLRSHPELLEDALGAPSAFDLLLGDPADDELLLHASPFLFFAVAVHHVVDELGRTRFVEERVGRRMRVPVFDAGQLREFGVDPARRYFMVEHLASYTRVMSGPVWVRRGDRWRRQRFSELDAARLAAALDAVPEADRPGIYRRLGDLALFLSGVFPDHSAAHPLPPRQLQRLARLLEDEAGPAELARAPGAPAGIWLMEWLGRRSYRLTLRAAGASAAELRGLVEGFGSARRVLNLLTGRYLYPSRERWFPTSGAP